MEGQPSPADPPRQPRSPHRFHAVARLQLAAALLEYDYERDGKLAEQSAIFAPYRQEPEYPAHGHVAAGSGHLADDGDHPPAEPQRGEAVVDHAHRASTRSAINTAATDGDFYTRATRIPSRLPNGRMPRESLDFLSPKSDNGLVGLGSPDPTDPIAARPATTQAIYDDFELNDEDLASGWGLDNVVSKFEKLDSNAFRMEASRLKAAATAAGPNSASPACKAGRRKSKGRKRSGTSGSDILLHLPDAEFTANLGKRNVIKGDHEEEEELDPALQLDSHSAPTVLNLNLDNRKLRHRSGSQLKTARKSLESELEMAFSAASGELDAIAASSDHDQGAKSRSSSLGAFNNDYLTATTSEIAKVAAVRAVTDYAAEAVARPASRYSVRAGGVNEGYVSRFDPKAVAAQREEEMSTRPRFPLALHPRTLIMPAPLAELEAEEKARKQAEETEHEEGNGTEKTKSRIEREPGKLYGKSLMDELQIRKERQKSRNRAFRGDSRVAMMDMKQFKIRSPSPLSATAKDARLSGAAIPSAHTNHEEGQVGSDDSDDDDKPLRPPGSTAPISDDPWIKYTSHRSLANVAKGKSTVEISTLAKEGVKPVAISPTLPSPETRNSFGPRLDTRRHTLSTAELQQEYKKNRQSMLALDQYAEVNQAEASDDDEDDDIPLDARKEQLTAMQNQKPSSPNTPMAPISPQHIAKPKMKELQSVFGVDLVMQKELAKLEQILEIEEAERRIKLERERIRTAEKEAKEAKKRAKAEKKERRRKQKDEARNIAIAKHKSSSEPDKTAHIDAHAKQTNGTDRASKAVPAAIDMPMQSPPLGRQSQYQRQSYYSRHGNGEMDDFFGVADEYRQNPVSHEIEEGALTPRPSHARSSSFAPSLTLPFLAGDGTSGESPNTPAETGWFTSDQGNRGNDSDNDEGSDREERVRCKSPFGIDDFASDDEERTDATTIWAESTEKDEPKMKEVTYDPSKIPELRRMSVAASFAGVLEGFGIGESAEGNGSDDEDDKENRKSSQFTRRLSIHEESDSEDERRPLSAILVGHHRGDRTLLPNNGRSPAKVSFEPPRLDLPSDFAIAAKEDSDSDAEDEAPLALKRINASLTAGTHGRTFDTEQNADEMDSEDDDLPLAVKQDDDKPLGQAHPVAALSQQMELQQQQNAALVAHMQLQYQYALQLQLQQAIIQQADIQGYTASQLNLVPPAAALSGAASDIGLDLGPDPKLVNSVDRWRQGVE